MANVSRPFGLRPSRYLGGNPWNAQAQLYGFSASQANDCFKGDLVTFDATNRSASLADPYYPALPFVAPVVAALTTTNFRGVVVGFLPQPDFNMSVTATLGLQYRQASTYRYGWVVDDYNVIFESEEVGNSYVTAANNGINKTVDVSYVAGNTTTGISKSGITGFQTAAVRPLRALRYTENVGNFNFSASDTNSYAHWDLLIANSDLRQTAQGA